MEIIPEKHTSLKESNDRMHLSGLRKKQKILSVAFMVIMLSSVICLVLFRIETFLILSWG